MLDNFDEGGRTLANRDKVVPRITMPVEITNLVERFVALAPEGEAQGITWVPHLQAAHTPMFLRMPRPVTSRYSNQT
jgi:hypothetical protein